MQAPRSPAKRAQNAGELPPELLPPAMQNPQAGPAVGEEGDGMRVRATVRATKVPIGHRLLEVRAVLKLTIPRARRLSSTLRWRSGDEGEQHKRSHPPGAAPAASSGMASAPAASHATAADPMETSGSDRTDSVRLLGTTDDDDGVSDEGERVSEELFEVRVQND